jgi:arabinose-5-phosphate isomerase
MPEGCPIGRAPMASTLMQLALGDCLAAMLMDQREFSDADFLALHHGGYLGADIRNSLCPK